MGPLLILLFVKCLLDIQFTIAFDVLETKWRKNAVMDTATKTDRDFHQLNAAIVFVVF